MKTFLLRLPRKPKAKMEANCVLVEPYHSFLNFSMCKNHSDKHRAGTMNAVL